MHKHSLWLNELLKDKPVPKENYIELKKRADIVHENRKLEHMTENQRKEYIMSKFLTARNNKDKVAMIEALYEFYDYDCRLLDKKFGITFAKDFIKDKSGLNNLVDYLDKVIDDGDIEQFTAKEKCWEVIKGIGDAIDDIIGTKGVTMCGILGAATKAVTLIPKAGKLLGGAIQAFFAVDGAVMFGEGTVTVINADTREDAREGGAQTGMGLAMLGGTAASVKTHKTTKGNAAYSKISNSKKLTRQELKEKLKSGVNVKRTNDGEVLIEIPKCKLRAPSSKFAETDDAFKDFIRLSKAEFLQLNQKSGDEFICSAFELLKNKMGLEEAPVNLKITNNNYSLADPETALVHIGRNWQGGDKAEILGAIAHELNHMFQYKEMHINSILEGQNLKLAPEFKKWIEDQPEFIDGHNQYYYDKAYIYKENFRNYIEPEQNLKAYRQQPVELESHKRGDIVRDEFKKVISDYNLDSLEQAALERIQKSYNNIDYITKMELLNTTVDHLKEPRFKNASIEEFVNWFLSEYPQ